MDRSSFEDLAGLIELTPRLAGALCRGSKDFDVDGFAGSRHTDKRDAAVEYAKSLCLKCPALSDCGSWLYSLRQADRPGGVVAAQLVASIPTGSAAPGQPRRVKVVSECPSGTPKRLQAVRHG
jgi:hypothetical protein